MKNTKKEMTAEFKKRYAEVSDKAKAVKAKLKEALKEAKALSKEAKALYDFGDARLYYTDDDGTPHPASKWIGDKMDLLESWTDCRLEIASVVDDL